MSKLEKLRKLYDELDLNTTGERELLAKVKSRNATEEEQNELIDLIKVHPNGGKKLDDLRKFEDKLVVEINHHIDALEDMESEATDAAHLGNQTAIDRANADMKVRYNDHVQKADEIYEAIKEAYFQVDNFDQYDSRLYEAKENLKHLD
jgi:hypothetical protein